ncbi:hypothetical protein C9J03_13285 [Photobacterium gaetbulicola]|uniref:Zn-ribbon motif protein n=1 Tax=Photobacterium gaetbulicola Gung47 TaxID=658445 RepID=A0A0C5WPL3_9GAMM|nr:hypothetical protein [Photobacterium gaetbulicola]AJR08247.1 hypothetical protein H744_2c1574 [Photobacterium gaetbulicola Gung47]PSU09073.1 hypothetical protein C9J03_13285 [Photobacterium gaetbulicola]
MAKPNKKGPTKTVDIYCAGCKTQLYKYRKGGKGALVKCFKERIVKDFTLQEGICPHCDQAFARDTLIRGAPALKMIGGKVVMK